jgi:hypothetical protein
MVSLCSVVGRVVVSLLEDEPVTNVALFNIVIQDHEEALEVIRL